VNDAAFTRVNWLFDHFTDQPPLSRAKQAAVAATCGVISLMILLQQWPCSGYIQCVVLSVSSAVTSTVLVYALHAADGGCKGVIY